MNGININYRFPYELLQFILSKSGNSLLIKGPPGGGKTTISLQILETLQGKGNIVYLSTRVGDTSLYQQFPWLKDLEKNLKIIIASKIILESISEVEEEEKEIVQYGKKFLQEITEEGPKNVSRVEYKKILKDKKAPEIKRIYDNVEMNLPNKSIIVIDSIEGISSRYGITEDVFVTMIQKDLVESVNTSVIFISEKYNVSPEDYIVDGVIYLNHEIDDGRRKRTLRINKLRGVEILQSSYAYTLKDGKFFTFYPEEYEKREITKFEFIKNEDNISTGIEDLDKILGGGLKPSSIFALEIGKDIPLDELRLLFRPIILNTLYNNIGIFIIPVFGWSSIRLEDDLTRFINKNTFESGLRYIDYNVEESNIPFVVPAGGSDKIKINQRIMKALLDLSGISERNILHIIGADTLEYLKGMDISTNEIFNMAHSIKSSKDIAIFTVRETQQLKNEIINISDYYFKLIEFENVPFIYGIKPKILYQAVMVDRNKGFPNITLVPMI